MVYNLESVHDEKVQKSYDLYMNKLFAQGFSWFLFGWDQELSSTRIKVADDQISFKGHNTAGSFRTCISKECMESGNKYFF